MNFTSQVPVSEFGIKSDKTFPAFMGDEFGELSALIPKKKDHVFDRRTLTFLRMWWVMGGDEPLYISGPTGCGKTTLIEQMAARVRVPLVDLVAREDLQKADLVGSFVLQEAGNGASRGPSMKFVDGPVTRVWRHGGILLVNEMTAAPPGFWVAHKDILAGRPLYIEATGEVIQRNQNARLVFTDNTRGLVGDDTGSYQGRFRQDAAVMDEGWKMRLDYMPAESEIALLKRGMPEFCDDPAESERLKTAFATALRRFAENVRSAYLGNSADGSALETTMSTRTLLRFRDVLIALRGTEQAGFKPIEDALDIALTNVVSDTSRMAIQKLAEMVLGTGGEQAGSSA
jgi:cobaltochelatase CobS